MRSLEKGQDKIQLICDKLRLETLQPAEKEASQIIEAAKKEKAVIEEEGRKAAEQLLKEARQEIEQERRIFESALEQASKQSLEGLRQEIEEHFFNEELSRLVAETTASPKIIADLLNALVKAIEKEGLQTELAAVIPQSISTDEVIALLIPSVTHRLKDHPIEKGSFAGGVQLKLLGKKMTVDITNETLKALLSRYIRKDLRSTLFR